MIRIIGEEPPEEDQPLPPEIQEELENMPDLTEEELKKYEHLEKPIMDAIKKAAAAKNKGKDIKPENNN